MENREQKIKKSPSWDEIFQEIGIQLHKRKNQVVLKATLIGLPGAIIAGVIEFFYRIGFFYREDLSINIFIYGTGFIVFVAIVSIIFNSIFKTEQTIWLDSYFDGRDLSQKESWRIARRLFWDSAYLNFKLFFRYYFWVLLTFVAAIGLWMLVFIYSGIPVSSWVLVISWLFVILIVMSLVIWTRYLKLRLSYASFLFLDRYKRKKIHSSIFWSDFFKELKNLHELSKGEVFMKNVLLEIGADLAMQLNEFIAARIKRGFDRAASLAAGPAAAAISSVGTTITLLIKEAMHRLVLFAKMTGRYVLYRFAFEALHKKKHEVNEYIYNLKNKK